MLNIRAEHYVCSMVILSNFGEGYFGGNRVTDTIFIGKPCANNFEEFKEACKVACERFDKNDRVVYRIPLMAIVQATTIDLQPLAKKHLAQLGFQSSGEHPRAKYTKDGGLTVWTMNARDFCVAIGYKTREEVDALLDAKPSIKDLEKKDPTGKVLGDDWDNYAHTI